MTSSIPVASQMHPYARNLRFRELAASDPPTRGGVPVVSASWWEAYCDTLETYNQSWYRPDGLTDWAHSMRTPHVLRFPDIDAECRRVQQFIHQLVEQGSVGFAQLALARAYFGLANLHPGLIDSALADFQRFMNMPESSSESGYGDFQRAVDWLRDRLSVDTHPLEWFAQLAIWPLCLREAL